MGKTTFDTLDLKGLRTLLHEMNTYKDLRSKLWNRWIELFKRNMNNKNLLVVEYFPSAPKDVVEDIATGVYKNTFALEVKKEDIVFVEKKDIWWWVKIYKDDLMVDMSFSKVQKLIR